MWWIIIFVIVIISIIGFTKDLSKETKSVQKQGGMRVKYRILINHFLDGNDNKARIIQETSTFINIGFTSAGGRTAIFITHTFGKVVIEWKVDSPVFGKHQLKWQFDENADQREMAEKVENEAFKYQSGILQKLSDLNGRG